MRIVADLDGTAAVMVGLDTVGGYRASLVVRDGFEHWAVDFAPYSATCSPPCSASQALRCSYSGRARATRCQKAGVWLGSTRWASSWTIT